MRYASNRLYQAIQYGNRNFYPQAVITFTDGRTVTVSKEEITTGGNLISDSAGSYTFPLGICVGKSIELTLLNERDQWKGYNFYGAKIFLRTCFDFEDSTEFFNIGTFTVIYPTEPGITINLQAVDEVYKLDKEYDPSTSTYPLTLGQLLRDVCSACDVDLMTGTFNNSDFIVQTPPEDTTYRSVVADIAMLAGGNAKFDEYNRLSIVPYDLEIFKDKDLDGGIFDRDDPNEYKTGDNADGGSFNPWTEGYVYDGGSFGDRNNYHILNGLVNPTIATEDVVITGIKMSETDTEEKRDHLIGKEGYVLQLENSLVQDDQIDTALRLIGDVILDLRIRTFASSHVAIPMIEFMDLAIIYDWKGNQYQSVITDCDFNYFGLTELKGQAENPITQNRYYTNPDTVKVRQELKKEQNKERTEREKAIKTMEDMIANSSGMYFSSEKQEDGSTIWYMHNKPTLLESDIIWKFTSETISVSNDGGKTFSAALNADGEAILNRIYVIGLDADYITTGTLQGKKNGKETFYLDCNTGTVRLVVDSFSLSNGDTIDSIAQKKVDGQTQADIFNKLTNNGNMKGIYMEGNNLYINFSYAKGGTLVLGGSQNTRGTLSILNSSDKEIGRWNNNGIDIRSGVIDITGDYGETMITDGHMLCLLDNTEVGLIGANGWYQNNNVKGLNFDLEYNGRYMTWAAMMNMNDPYYTVKLLYAKNAFDSYIADRLYSHCIFVPMRGIYFSSDGSSIKGHTVNYTSGIGIYADQSAGIYMGMYDTTYFNVGNNGYVNVHAMLNMHNFSIINESDERLKTNIQESDVSALDVLNKVRLFSFDWVKDGTHKDLGFIAQQLEQEVPADFTETGEVQGEKYTKDLNMIPYLVKAVQELTERVENLEGQLNAKNVRISSLEKMVSQRWEPSEMSLAEKTEFADSLEVEPIEEEAKEIRLEKGAKE